MAEAEKDRRRVVIAGYLEGDHTPVTCAQFHRLWKDPSRGVRDQYEHIWRMAYVRGPEGIIVSLAERIG
jgi:hypothetical protein